MADPLACEATTALVTLCRPYLARPVVAEGLKPMSFSYPAVVMRSQVPSHASATRWSGLG
jgi:hypothetical protein